MSSGESLLRVGGLNVRLPDGQVLLSGASLAVDAGEAVVIAGPSGSGKSTLVRALFEREALLDEGFGVDIAELQADGDLGLVPQRGAPFDHLDVAGNLRLAIRHSPRRAEAGREAIARHLEAVDLDSRWAAERRRVVQLSGGQAQRLAVARVLASGRRILFLDEPSVGLDPPRVRRLAAQLRRLCDEEGAAVVVVTHDPALTAELADRLLVLADGGLAEVELPARDGAGVRQGSALLQSRDIVERALDATVTRGKEGGGRRGAGRAGRMARAVLGPFVVLVRAPWSIPFYAGRHLRELLHVLALALRQSLVRPFLFYLIVSYLLGLTVLYVLTTFGGELGPEEAVRIVRGLPLLALTPPLSAFLFVATSASAVNAWLGNLRLSRQIAAMEALGVSRVSYLWGPSWLALCLGYLGAAVTFAAGFLAGQVTLGVLLGMDDAYPVLSSDLLDPPPERAPYRTRAIALCLIYAVGCASDAVARADAPKPDADSVTRAMTRSVVACTLWVVIWELLSLILLRTLRGGA